MIKHFRFCMAIFWGVVLSFVAVEATFACDPATQPCSVVFTLNEQNDLVLKHVEEGPRTEGVLRLTSDEAKLAAQGPVATTNILMLQNQGDDEFAEAIARLSKIPGLQFLNNPAAAQKAANEATGHAGEAMQLSGAKSGDNQMCAQMHLVMKATLDEATSAAFDQADYITAPEIEQACGKAAAAKMVEWYQAEQRKKHAHF